MWKVSVDIDRDVWVFRVNFSAPQLIHPFYLPPTISIVNLNHRNLTPRNPCHWFQFAFYLSSITKSRYMNCSTNKIQMTLNKGDIQKGNMFVANLLYSGWYVSIDTLYVRCICNSEKMYLLVTKNTFWVQCQTVWI